MFTHSRQVRAPSKEANIGTSLRKARAKVAARPPAPITAMRMVAPKNWPNQSKEIAEFPTGSRLCSCIDPALSFLRQRGQFLLIRAQFQSEKRIV
jgi:hypothetical protein